MADWTDARPSSCSALFAAEYARLNALHASVIADTLDRAAYFRIPSGSVFSTRDRPLAVCHMAAHMLESVPADGSNARAGGPMSAKSNERGSASYATVPIGMYFGIAEYLLQSTNGGRNLLAMIAGQPSLSGMVL